MTIRTPYEFGPAGPDGEMMIAPTDPIGAALPNHTYYLTRRFHFGDGDYTITVAADDGASVWIGTTQLNSRLIARCAIGEPETVRVNIPQGDYRLDVMLQNAVGPSYVILIIKRGDSVIYASSKDGWLLDDAAISDADLPPPADYRFSLPVFTTLPNWRDGITERLMWLTDVMESETAAEQRRSVRRNARRQFEANFLRQRNHRDRLDTFFVGMGSAEFMVPLWHEAVRMDDGIDAGASGVRFTDGELEFREFYKGDLVLVNAGDPDDYDVLQVGDVDYGAGRFAWAFPPPRSWPAGTRIYPMRTARLQVPPRMSNITDTVSSAGVQFDLSEPYKVEASWGGAASGLPYFTFVPDRATPLDVQYGRKSYTIDNESGVPITLDHGRFTATTVAANFRLFGRPAAARMRRFLQAARGRAVHFFAPTFMQDIELAGDIANGSQEIAIEPQGFYQYMLRPQAIRIQLAFQLRVGGNVYATITNVAPVYSESQPRTIVGEVLTLDRALPHIARHDLKRVSFVAETRLDQDAVELHHHTNQQAAVDVSLTFRQAFNQRVGNPA